MVGPQIDVKGWWGGGCMSIHARRAAPPTMHSRILPSRFQSHALALLANNPSHVYIEGETDLLDTFFPLKNSCELKREKLHSKTDTNTQQP